MPEQLNRKYEGESSPQKAAHAPLFEVFETKLKNFLNDQVIVLNTIECKLHTILNKREPVDKAEAGDLKEKRTTDKASQHHPGKNQYHPTKNEN